MVGYCLWREHTAAVASDGFVFTWGILGGLEAWDKLGHCSLQSPDKELLPRRIVALDCISVKDVACGGAHTCAFNNLTRQKELFTLGVVGKLSSLDLVPRMAASPRSQFFRYDAVQSSNLGYT